MTICDFCTEMRRVTLKELREVFGMVPVSLPIKKSRWFGPLKHKYDTIWIKADNNRGKEIRMCKENMVTWCWLKWMLSFGLFQEDAHVQNKYGND